MPHMNTKTLLLTALAAVSLLGVTARAQRTGVREEVLSDWNKCSGLDCVYDTSPKASTPAPKGYEAVYISHYGRHGSRYAYTERSYTILLDMLSEGLLQDNLTPYGEQLLWQLKPFWEHVRYRVGDLTPKGWQQHQAIASTMVHSFPSVFGEGSVVDACSSASVRAIISMSSCCAALSREAPLAQVYEHQGMTDVQATRPNQGNNPFRYEGPSLPNPYPEKSEAFFFRKFPQYTDVLARLFKDPYAALGLRNPYDVFFHLYMFVAGMNSLADDERLDVSGFFTPEEYATLWETDNYERFREYYEYRTSCSSIVDDMVSKADARLSEGVRGADLRFGHDHVVMALLMIMDLDGFGTVPASPDDLVYYFHTFRSPMAANIQFIFFRPVRNKPGDTLVKVLLNGEEARLGTLPPFQGPYYKWEDARAYLKGRTGLFVFHPEEKGWTRQEIDDGLSYLSFSGTETVSGAAQQIFITDWDMSKPGYALRFKAAVPGQWTSDVMKENNATVAMNACYETGSVVLKVDGEYLSCMPDNKIIGTDVPNWKSEAAVYTDGGRDVRIAFDGKGMTTAEQRRFYATSTEPNIFSSAPMLIDDYRPVGEVFSGSVAGDALLNFAYEDPRRHQGVRHPRTAVAITGDGHLLMVVVDGRRPGISEGMTARELTLFLKDNFNPRYALNMDGGGSSTLCVAGQGDPETHVVNYPPNNQSYDHAGERRVTSHFILVKTTDR